MAVYLIDQVMRYWHDAP